MVNNNKTPESIKKYIKFSDEDLKSLIAKYPFFNIPKIALLIKNHETIDPKVLHHIALTSYDRKQLQEYLKNAAFFLS